jgi:hypothetical protein
MGGGAARNGGIGNRTGLTTGNVMYGVAGRDGVTFSGRPGGFAQQPGAYGIKPGPAISQGPVARPAAPHVPGLLDNPPAVPTIEDVPMPPVQEPYNPLTSVTPPAPFSPPSYFMADRVRMPNLYDMAMLGPNANWRGNTAGFSNSFYDNPTLGTPGIGGSGLGQYGSRTQGTATGGKTDLGGSGGMRQR